jgi:hypothetical protein
MVLSSWSHAATLCDIHTTRPDGIQATSSNNTRVTNCLARDLVRWWDQSNAWLVPPPYNHTGIMVWSDLMWRQIVWRGNTSQAWAETVWTLYDLLLREGLGEAVGVTEASRVELHEAVTAWMPQTVCFAPTWSSKWTAADSDTFLSSYGVSEVGDLLPTMLRCTAQCTWSLTSDMHHRLVERIRLALQLHLALYGSESALRAWTGGHPSTSDAFMRRHIPELGTILSMCNATELTLTL